MGRTAAGFAAVGACVGVIGDLVWAWAAGTDRRCYTSVNLNFYGRDGYTDGSCYEPGSRSTWENGWVIGVTLLMAIIGAGLAAGFFVVKNRWAALAAVVILSAAVLGGLVAVVPFKSVPAAELPPPWWPGPVTPPVWVLPVLLGVAFAVAVLFAAPSTRVAGTAVTVALATVAALIAGPVATGWQRQTDRAACSEITQGFSPDVLVWC